MRIWLAMLAVACVGCEPKFRGKGALFLDGEAFTPVRCRVLPPRATGIELADASSTTLTLELPAETLRAFEGLGGTAEVALTVAGKAPSALGACARLTMKGEGYHGDEKRAASGTATLECPQLKGTLTFSGCF